MSLTPADVFWFNPPKFQIKSRLKISILKYLNYALLCEVVNIEVTIE